MIRVCHVVHGSCSRVHKLAMVQRREGTVIPFLLNYYLNPVHPFEQYEAIFRYFPEENDRPNLDVFQRQVRVIDGLIDLWHVHNEQDWIAPLVRSVSEKPIIWDVHDMKSHQTQRDEFQADEDASAQSANHIFTVSRSYERMLAKRFGAEKVSSYPSAVPREMYPIVQARASREGIVYEGGFSTDKWSHREWGPFFEKAGVPAVIFSAQIRNYKPPEHIIFLPTISPFLLLRTMRFFEAGLCGSPGFGPHPQVDGGLQNKVYEYVAAGIPIIGVNPPEDMRAFIEGRGVGVIIERPEQVRDALEMIRKSDMRAQAAWTRDQLTLDEVYQTRVLPVYHRLVEEK